MSHLRALFERFSFSPHSILSRSKLRSALTLLQVWTSYWLLTYNLTKMESWQFLSATTLLIVYVSTLLTDSRKGSTKNLRALIQFLMLYLAWKVGSKELPNLFLLSDPWRLNLILAMVLGSSSVVLFFLGSGSLTQTNNLEGNPKALSFLTLLTHLSYPIGIAILSLSLLSNKQRCQFGLQQSCVEASKLFIQTELRPFLQRTRKPQGSDWVGIHWHLENCSASVYDCRRMQKSIFHLARASFRKIPERGIPVYSTLCSRGLKRACTQLDKIQARL